MDLLSRAYDSIASDSSDLARTLAIVGSLWAVYRSYKFASFTYLYFLRPSSLDRYKISSTKSSNGTWALVTGASDGIGKGMAQELCHRGFNVVLHGRNEKKLQTVRDELLAEWPARSVRILLFDAGSEAADSTRYEAAAQQLSDLDLKILVNNVGGAGGISPTWTTLDKRTCSEVGTFIDLNARFPTEITRVLLPQLAKCGPSMILNVGSAAGEIGCPYISVYSGAKAYNKAWSRSLRGEMAAEGVDIEVLHLIVGIVSSSEPRETGLLCPSSRTFARHALDKVGCGLDVVYGYWPHAMQFETIQLLPAWLCDWAAVGIAKQEKAAEEAKMKQQ